MGVYLYFASQGFSVRYILAQVFRSAIFGERSGPKILGYSEDGTLGAHCIWALSEFYHATPAVAIAYYQWFTCSFFYVLSIHFPFVRLLQLLRVTKHGKDPKLFWIMFYSYQETNNFKTFEFDTSSL